MHRSTRQALGLLLILFPALALAQGDGRTVYRWVDAQGQVHYSDRPQPGAHSVQLQAPSSVSANPPPAAPASEANRAACAAKQRELQGYQRADKLAQRDVFGKEREFTAEERERFLAMQAQEVARLCGDAASAP